MGFRHHLHLSFYLNQKVSVIFILSELKDLSHFHFIWNKKSQSFLIYLNQKVSAIYTLSKSKSLSHFHFIWIKKSQPFSFYLKQKAPAIFILSESKCNLPEKIWLIPKTAEPKNILWKKYYCSISNRKTLGNSGRTHSNINIDWFPHNPPTPNECLESRVLSKSCLYHHDGPHNDQGWFRMTSGWP